ncbi:MAG TPA: alkaline phosphatase PhoX [Hanamia sp.]|nr:alkaline phosphatase PhoX [Hanamia sp.]
MNNSRRNFLKNSGIVSLGFLGLNSCVLSGCMVNAEPGIGFGPLQFREGEILSLPKGFSAKVISSKGNIMSDGLFSPGSHDGMGMFDWKDGRVLLIRNHELTPGSYGEGPFGKGEELINKIGKDKFYDFAGGWERACVGGTTTMIYNEQSQKIESEYLSLVGTVRNCSGGKTPWNTWITCEETSDKKGDENGTLEKDHGYNFEVPATDKIGVANPVPIKAMGRFVHESACVHPESGVIYQTEDEGDGLFYRYIPNNPGHLLEGGRLQCLAINEWKSADTRNSPQLKTDPFPEKKLFDISWIDLDEVESPDGDLRHRGFLKGAAKFTSGEGLSYGNNEVFFTCSAGGKSGNGQIFRYIPSKYEGQPEEKDAPAKLELFIESKSIDTFRYCDNITVAPWGDVIICEDSEDARVIGITPEGKSYAIAKNIGYRESEFAGPVFSPSGKTLFINIQSPGLTLAITGPWRS